MPKTAEQGIRYRFSVPEQDAAVHEWIKNQLNVSMSLRMLIKEDVNKNGYSDVTCRVVREIPRSDGAQVRPTVVQPSMFQQKSAEENVGSHCGSFPSGTQPMISAAAMGLIDDD